MFAKRLLQKAAHHHHHQHDEQPEILQGSLKADDIDPRIISHYGVPSTASILAVDSIQQLIAIGTLDGRIKVIGGHNIECLFISPEQLPYKYLEFLENQGFLVGVTHSNEIQVWNLERQCIDSCLQWESNITAFCVINGSPFMFTLNEHGMISVLKYIPEDGKLVCMPYNISAMSIAERAGFSFSDDQPVVGLLAQPCSFGNRILIAYEIGLLILWDIAEAQAICVRGDKDLEMKAQLSDFPVTSDTDPSGSMVHKLDEKEISAVCWASSCGNVLAVGYTDGDILLWDIATNASAKSHHKKRSQNDIVKLQLSSAEKRFPIITLRWASTSTSEENDGQLFIYGGVEIGSEEVVTVVNLQWSSGAQNLMHVYRTDLSLTGSFSDIGLLSPFGIAGWNSTSGLFILSNPGKLQFYDRNSLSVSTSQLERTPPVPIVESPLVMHPSEPHITATKVTYFNPGLDPSQMESIDSNIHSDEAGNWPLNGGIPSFVPSAEAKQIEKVYVTGHEDGSVRLYDASCTMLRQVSVLENQADGIELFCSNDPISTIDLCAVTMDLAVGNEAGLVYVYHLKNDPDGTKIHVIDNSNHEVYEAPPKNGAHCKAIFHLVSSPTLVIQFSESGRKLAVGYKSNHVAVLDITSLSVLFLLDSLPESKGPVDSINWKTFRNFNGVSNDQELSVEAPGHPPEELIFSLTSDGKFNIIDGNTGNAISPQPMHVKSEVKAISMYVLGNSAPVSSADKQPKEMAKEIENERDFPQEDSSKSSKPIVTGNHSNSDGRLLDSLVLICFENSLHLCAIKSAFQGKDKTIRKVQLQKPCCWTATFSKHDKLCGLVLLYETGTLEVRSLPDLEVVAESSLMSILRWNFRPKMEKIISSTENGQIILVNGCELAYISLSADEDYFRAVKSLPCLHDQVLAAAAEAAISHTSHQKNQAALSRLVAGFKKDRPIYTKDADFSGNSKATHLDAIFSRDLIAGTTSSSRSEDIEELNIDDIVIDDPVPVASTSSIPHKLEGKAAKGKGAETERERLFEGATVDTKPRARTVDEIKAKYRKDSGDAASSAEHARDKLLERQEKLERLSKRTEDLRDGAENFSSMANELAKNMQARKWWQI